MRYEVCQLVTGRKDAVVCGPFSLVDTALEEARRRSLTSTTDLMVVLVDEDRYGLVSRTVRAFGVRGLVDWAKRCDACLGTGSVEQQINRFVYEQVVCSCCSGVGSLPDALTLRPPPPRQLQSGLSSP